MSNEKSYSATLPITNPFGKFVWKLAVPSRLWPLRHYWAQMFLSSATMPLIIILQQAFHISHQEIYDIFLPVFVAFRPNENPLVKCMIFQILLKTKAPFPATLCCYRPSHLSRYVFVSCFPTQTLPRGPPPFILSWSNHRTLLEDPNKPFHHSQTSSNFLEIPISSMIITPLSPPRPHSHH